MTTILSHQNSRIGYGHNRHTYIVDVGCGIEIPLIEVSPLYENQLASPPYPVTRFFEIEIDEVTRDGCGSSAFQHILPVNIERTPDWHILMFRIKRGKITVTERIPKSAEDNEAQWIYTDDFHLLFLSSGGRHDAVSLLNLITTRLDTIALSIRKGDRIPSEFENQQTCRAAFRTMFAGGINGDLSEAVIFRQHASAISEELDRRSDSPAVTGGTRCQVTRAAAAGTEEDLHIDITMIEELRDTSWLVE